MNDQSAFADLRPLLFTIAYEILGSASDAEDVLQESYIRWHNVEPDDVVNARALLTQIVTRLSLNQLRTVRRRREDYVGPWLPEPVRTQSDASEDVILAESVSMAMLLVLEALGSTERAVFVLGEVFGYSHGEISRVIGKSVPAVRQIAHRARTHVRSRRKRFDSDSDTQNAVVGKFLIAAKTGDIEALLEVLAADVVEIADGGGKVSAARKPVVGPENVARLVAGLGRGEIGSMSAEVFTCNSLPAVAFSDGTRLDSVLLFEIVDSRIVTLYAVRNPDKLGGSNHLRELTRGRDQ